MSSKFVIGDHVRVTNPALDCFDRAGVVTGYAEIQCEAASEVILYGLDYEMTFKQSSLTLADSEPHAVAPESSSSPTAGLEKLVADVYAASSVGTEPPTPNRRAVVLRTAESLVNGQRADDYGPPQENFGRVAAMWSAQFAAKLKEPLTADEVAIALVHLKLSRLANTPDHADSFIDAAGYIALAAEIAEAAL